MTALNEKDRVKHKSDASLGVGIIRFTEDVAGVRSVYVAWDRTPEIQKYTEAQLEPVEDLPDRLGKAGPAATIEFQLRVLGRWFEARHEQTGEITNQPFDMLPHQVVVTNRVLRSSPAADGGLHWLIADDVGLGKTIEAGMILEVMRRKRGGSLRCLVVAPAGLVYQWKVELHERFGRVFEPFETHNVNKLETFNQIIASIDTLKLEKYKKALLETHPWDLVIFDEAHHLTRPGVLNYELAKDLREKKKSKNTLFLTATPHSGNHEHFCNLLNLLRPDRVPRPTKSLKELPALPLAEIIIRNRKHSVTDARGNKIFHGIAPAQVMPYKPTPAEVELAEEVRDYLKQGYNEAGKLEKKEQTAVGFLMATFAKLASSSRQALGSALQRRLALLRNQENGTEEANSNLPDEVGDVGKATKKGKKGKQSLISGEATRVERLLARLEALPGVDSKLAGFTRGLQKLDQEKAGLKVLIFTEYRATQEVLAEKLADLFGKESVGIIHGSMPMDKRKEVVLRFNTKDEPRFIVSTAAGGEGLNMQRRCHTIVNYDLPWNPNVLQQRIGRVYRYGQTKPVVVLNLKVETDSDAFADSKVYEYLGKKLGHVADALAQAQGEGEGKEDLLGDVLGHAAEHGLSLEELHEEAIKKGEKKVEETIDQKAKHLEEIMKDREMIGMFNGLPRFNLEDYENVQSRVTSDHLAFFVKQYCEYKALDYREQTGRRFSFTPSEELAALATERQKRDPYAVRETVSTDKVRDATVDKAVAQASARLLRFGDPIFEAMVQHVQYQDFSAVASLDVPAQHLGWPARQLGTWLLFDLGITRTEGKQSLVLERELASFIIPIGSDTADPKPELVEHVTETTQGPSQVDVTEARRAFEIGRKAAESRLIILKDKVCADYVGDKPLEPIPAVSELALAWVRAV